MRIGVNARFLIKGRLEGLGWYSYHVLRNMVTNHPEHEYYFFFDRKPDPSFLFNNSVKPFTLLPPARHPVLWYWWFEHAIPKALIKHKIDLFFSPDGYSSLSTSIPQYLVIHDLAYLHYPKQIPIFVKKYYEWFVPKQIACAQHLFAVSESTKNDLINQFKIPVNKISVAYNGVRNEFKPLNEQEINRTKKEFSSGKDYFLFVGAIHPRKNIDKLIQAFDIFKKSSSTDFMLLIIGRKAWFTKEAEAAFNRSEYQTDIIFYSYFDTIVLARITAAAFSAINPSFLEGFGVPILEALYCDVPVMVSNRFSLPEVAGPGAIVFNPDEVDGIAAAMMQAVIDPIRKRRIELGRIHRQKFNWELTSEIIYTELMQTPFQ